MTEEQRYSISQYHDVDDVYRRLYALVGQPMRRVRPEVMKEYLEYFEKKCARSKGLTDEAKRFIPGGVQHNLAFNHPFPIAIAKADGAYLWDVDGNQYIDFSARASPWRWSGARCRRIERALRLIEQGRIRLDDLVSHRFRSTARRRRSRSPPRAPGSRWSSSPAGCPEAASAPGSATRC